MSVEPERIRALDGHQMISARQTVSTYAVMLDGGSLETMELTAAQARGFECLTCRAQHTATSGAFRSVGRIPSVGNVFQCLKCVGGAR
ncbi:hypothetical protein SAMN05421507_1166 [Lentzea jiangxiensis]|uniref:Uncharacterized protein n=1 Tax=Lentzea jiangxiensis TaxID=641025 RepID=A0A1H0VWW7_9PSEU|nr:hypothetical protein SAMN05421507_1166 [Lentzea jiangxiensis]